MSEAIATFFGDDEFPVDWENGQKVIELLRDAAHDRGASILCVSHDARLLPFVDVYYHLDDGHLERRELPGE